MLIFVGRETKMFWKILAGKNNLNHAMASAGKRRQRRCENFIDRLNIRLQYYFKV